MGNACTHPAHAGRNGSEMGAVPVPFYLPPAPGAANYNGGGAAEQPFTEIQAKLKRVCEQAARQAERCEVEYLRAAEAREAAANILARKESYELEAARAGNRVAQQSIKAARDKLSAAEDECDAAERRRDAARARATETERLRRQAQEASERGRADQLSPAAFDALAREIADVQAELSGQDEALRRGTALAAAAEVRVAEGWEDREAQAAAQRQARAAARARQFY